VISFQEDAFWEIQELSVKNAKLDFHFIKENAEDSALLDSFLSMEIAGTVELSIVKNVQLEVNVFNVIATLHFTTEHVLINAQEELSKEKEFAYHVQIIVQNAEINQNVLYAKINFYSLSQDNA
jgi:hypothetical protein